MADLGNYHVWLSYLGIEFGRFLRHVLCYWCLDSHGGFVYRSFLDTGLGMGRLLCAEYLVYPTKTSPAVACRW